MVRVLLAFALLAGFMSHPAEAQVNRVPPVDRCASDRSFVAFRARLRTAVARRDAVYLLSIVAPDIPSEPGGSGGRAGFIREWRLDRPGTSPIWRDLGIVLRLGCARDPRDQLWVPSMSLPEPTDPDDVSYEGGVVAIVPGAALREAPSDRARVVARLYSDVLSLYPDDDRRSVWAHAGLDQHRAGYVRRSQTWSYTAHRAVFARRRSQWRLISFVEGD